MSAAEVMSLAGVVAVPEGLMRVTERDSEQHRALKSLMLRLLSNVVLFHPRFALNGEKV